MMADQEFKEKHEKMMEELEEEGLIARPFLGKLFGWYYLTKKGAEECARFRKRNPQMHFLIFTEVYEFMKKEGKLK